MIRFIAHSDGKIIIPDERVEIPRDRALEVTVQEADTNGQQSSSRDALLALVEQAERIDGELPTDLAANHDHYLYGTPKR